ncbi:hypothetical protein [Cecembia lonarensis]|uniref:Uncharacterized protein n=1 Tax=Cecembia lonarensis (strain CCUG 58316 / KCTC 22772 / LW9) TaxID=1225176 RepID=K1L3S7_CECL9|nr:hypothetical protein [Cecembia lonarensis]EKB49476.1 hypothetical protein B879_01873 [Cecembia lonarensis LW9]
MNRDDLKKFVKPYRETIQVGEPGRDEQGRAIKEQSQWVFFDRATIEKLLRMTDANKGGIKVYFGQYDRENLYLVPQDRRDREQYIGKISVALSAANEEQNGIFDVFLNSEGQRSDANSIENGGMLCPPYCEPPINT